MSPTAHLLPDGKRLHLQHGPIDLIIGAEGPGSARDIAFSAAHARFQTVLEELVAELPLLRTPLSHHSDRPQGQIARRMDRATRPHADQFVTRMAAVAGSVADTVLAAMVDSTDLTRAYVNNGGDIALHLARGQTFTMAMQAHDGFDLGRVAISDGQGVGGVATSGRHGRSLSLGIADSVTVLAASAAAADAAATLIANAVDLPDHPAIHRTCARDLDPDSDLGDRLAVTGCAPLVPDDIARALSDGLHAAQTMKSKGLIIAASLFLQGEIRLTGPNFTAPAKEALHA